MISIEEAIHRLEKKANEKNAMLCEHIPSDAVRNEISNDYDALKMGALALKKQEKRIPIKKHTHLWKKNNYNGEINYFAYSQGDCNGPECIICGYSFCHHCTNGYDTICPIGHYVCPDCNSPIEERKTYCSNCSQAILWE